MAGDVAPVTDAAKIASAVCMVWKWKKFYFIWKFIGFNRFQIEHAENYDVVTDIEGEIQIYGREDLWFLSLFDALWYITP